MVSLDFWSLANLKINVPVPFSVPCHASFYASPNEIGLSRRSVCLNEWSPI